MTAGPVPSWAAYRQEVFGEPYMVWHDGPDFTEIARRFRDDPAAVPAMLRIGISEKDDVARPPSRHDQPMATWLEFEAAAPTLAAEVRKNLYEVGIGLGFLATVRTDGAPRVHPVCPILSPAGLHVLIVPGPKQHDLRRDGRYALHTETCPPPQHEDGCMLTGTAVEVTEASIRDVVVDQLRSERDDPVLWPSVRTDALFELLVDSCLLVRTLDSAELPAGPTVWKAG
jgi:hypothetical protein